MMPRDARCSLRRPGFLTPASLGLGLTHSEDLAKVLFHCSEYANGEVLSTLPSDDVLLWNQILMIHAKAAELDGFIHRVVRRDRSGCVGRCSGPALTR